jgi:hypothetical protein
MGPSPSTGRGAPSAAADSPSGRGPRSARAATSRRRPASGATPSRSQVYHQVENGFDRLAGKRPGTEPSGERRRKAIVAFHGQPPPGGSQQDFIAEPPEDLDFATLLRAIDGGRHETGICGRRWCVRIRRKADRHHPSRRIEHDPQGALLARIGRSSTPSRPFFRVRPDLRTLVFFRLSRFSKNLTDLLLRDAGRDTRPPSLLDGGTPGAAHHDRQCYEAPGNETSPLHERSPGPALLPLGH